MVGKSYEALKLLKLSDCLAQHFHKSIRKHDQDSSILK